MTDGTTDGFLLGGRLRYRQTTMGHRTGLEPLLLAASVPAKPGDKIVEGGTGAGAGLLCLASRVPDIEAVGLEIDPSLARLASENFSANHFAGLTSLAQDVTAWSTDSVYDHAFANPPWYLSTATASPDPAKKRAKQASDDLIAQWSMALAARVRRGGTVSLILPAARLADGMNALTRARCTEVTVIPLWPRQGQAAKLLILRGVRLGKGGCRLLAGITLHGAGSSYSEAANNVLKEGLGLSLDEH